MGGSDFDPNGEGEGLFSTAATRNPLSEGGSLYRARFLGLIEVVIGLRCGSKRTEEERIATTETKRGEKEREQRKKTKTSGERERGFGMRRYGEGLIIGG